MRIIASANFRSCLRVRGGILSKQKTNQILKGNDFREVIESATGFYPDSAPSQILDLPWLWSWSVFEQIPANSRKQKNNGDRVNRPRFCCTADGKKIPFKTVIVPTMVKMKGGPEEDRWININRLHKEIGVKPAKQIKKNHAKIRKKRQQLIKQVSSIRPSHLWVYSEECKGVTFSAELNTEVKAPPFVTFVFFLHLSPIPDAFCAIDKCGNPVPFIDQRELLLFAMSLPVIVIGEDVLPVNFDDLSTTGCEELIIRYQKNQRPISVFNS